MLIQKAIDDAIFYVDNLKTYTKAADIIDNLLKAVQTYSRIAEDQMSGLEMALCEFEYHKENNERLRRIIELYGADPELSNDEILFLEEIKEQSQYYTGDSTRKIISQYVFIDAYLKKYQPKKETRPKTINQVQEGFNKLIIDYDYKNRQDQI